MRTRKSAPKSHLGCTRCKQRRIKCDETRPSCRKCASLGVECPGFKQHYRFSDKHERISSSVQKQRVRRQAQDNGIIPNPVHLPTMLIEHWFNNVCPMWSTFDSPINFNRAVPFGTWTTSAAVFYVMQAMAATCLVDVMADLGPTVSSLIVEATGAIKSRMTALRTLDSPAFSPDLGFAVFASAMLWQWMNPLSSENAWLETARELVERWGQGLEDESKITYVYFYQALTYLEMLHSPFGRGSISMKLHGRWRQRQERLSQGIRLPSSITQGVPFKTICPGTRPNSWCGVSNEVIDVFGQVIALCRLARSRRRGEPESTSLEPTLCDVFLAHELQDELLAMDFSTIILQEEAQGAVVHTDDDKTPVAHLLLTAEAYRLAAMLQLHLEFQSLASPQDSSDRLVFLLRLALQLLDTLEQIPTESGAKTMHLMLYLSVAGALNDDAPDPKSVFERSSARRRVWEKLQTLRQQLPSHAMNNALHFVKEIWERKNGDSTEEDAFWLDMLTQPGSTVMLW